MVHLNYSVDFSQFSDGAGNVRYLMDLTKDLSQLYGKLIRQGQVVKVRSIQFGLENPNTTSQDIAMAAAGDVYYYHPTQNRKNAWKAAFKAVQAHRRLLGIQAQGYDFRVGFRGNSNWDTVDFNAWIRDENQHLVLGYHPDGQNSCFTVHNDRLMDASTPVDPDINGFGTPFDVPGIGVGDLDFTDQDNPFYSEGYASTDMNALRFQVAAAGAYDDFGSGGDWGTWTNTDKVHGPIHAMCGLIGIDIDTSMVDDSEGQTQDTRLTMSVDVESWSPILKPRKTRKTSKRKTSSRRRRSRK
jgi:hypothetical protein